MPSFDLCEHYTHTHTLHIHTYKKKQRMIDIKINPSLKIDSAARLSRVQIYTSLVVHKSSDSVLLLLVWRARIIFTT